MKRNFIRKLDKEIEFRIYENWIEHSCHLTLIAKFKT